MMQLDVIYTENETYLSKKGADTKTWQKQLYFYQEHIRLEKEQDFLNFLQRKYLLPHASGSRILEEIRNHYTSYFLLEEPDENTDQARVIPMHMDILSYKGTLIYFKDWEYLLYILEGAYHLWVYAGGREDHQREIRLSEKQVQQFRVQGKSYMLTLVEEVRISQSAIYEEARREGRKIR